MTATDPRRGIPRTDALLDHPQVRTATASMSPRVVRDIIRSVQHRARAGDLDPGAVESEVLHAVGALRGSSLRPVINATGVITHTNLGRAPLSDVARAALDSAAGYVDLEMDLDTGKRSRRGAGARRALLQACPAAEDALIVNNGAAALLLATTALAGAEEVIISRGELVEIGAGFRLPDLVVSTGAALREVGTTNRTCLEDYRAALSSQTGCILKVHPSNYWVSGFTSSVSAHELGELCTRHRVPLVVDVGSGLLHPEPMLPEEPDITEALRAGADVVTASGDKLLGGPQAGLILGSSAAISKLARHPLARALRADKLTLAGLEATLTGGATPTATALHADPTHLRHRCEDLARAVGGSVVPHEGRVGGGGGAGVPLPGWAVRLPEALAEPLRRGRPAVLTRVTESFCLVDLRCVPVSADTQLSAAIISAQKQD